MADNTAWAREQTYRVRDFYNVYTRGFSAEDFQRLFTRDTRDAYRYFSNAASIARHWPRCPGGSGPSSSPAGSSWPSP